MFRWFSDRATVPDERTSLSVPSFGVLFLLFSLLLLFFFFFFGNNDNN